MLTPNIRLINFKKIKKKIFKSKLKKFKKINFIAEYPLLETLTKIINITIQKVILKNSKKIQ